MSQREDSVSTGMQYLFKNKIAPNPMIQMFHEEDVSWAMVDVEDVAEAVYKAASINGLHGKNYLLSSESYPVSDITLMLNEEEPVGNPEIVYRNKLAMEELEMDFNPAKVPLNKFSS